MYKQHISLQVMCVYVGNETFQNITRILIHMDLLLGTSHVFIHLDSHINSIHNDLYMNFILILRTIIYKHANVGKLQTKFLELTELNTDNYTVFHSFTTN